MPYWVIRVSNDNELSLQLNVLEQACHVSQAAITDMVWQATGETGHVVIVRTTGSECLRLRYHNLLYQAQKDEIERRQYE